METTIIKWDESMAIRCFSKYPDSKKKATGDTGKATVTVAVESTKTDKTGTEDIKVNADQLIKPDYHSYSGDSDIKQWENFRRALTY